MLDRHARRGRQRLALRSARIGVIVPPAAQPLQLLGDVGQLQLDRAGAHERLERAVDLGVDEPGQRPGRARIAGTDPRCRIAQPEHPIAESATLLLLEHIAQQRLEHRGISIKRVADCTRGRRRPPGRITPPSDARQIARACRRPPTPITDRSSKSSATSASSTCQPSGSQTPRRATPPTGPPGSPRVPDDRFRARVAAERAIEWRPTGAPRRSATLAPWGRAAFGRLSDRATRGGGGVKAIVRTVAAGRSRLGEIETSGRGRHTGRRFSSRPGR